MDSSPITCVLQQPSGEINELFDFSCRWERIEDGSFRAVDAIGKLGNPVLPDSTNNTFTFTQGSFPQTNNDDDNLMIFIEGNEQLKKDVVVVTGDYSQEESTPNIEKRLNTQVQFNDFKNLMNVVFSIDETKILPEIDCVTFKGYFKVEQTSFWDCKCKFEGISSIIFIIVSILLFIFLVL